MSNMLIATMPASGHVNPMLAIARKLVERGHTVHWYCGKPFAAKIEAVGATVVEMRSIPQRGLRYTSPTADLLA